MGITSNYKLDLSSILSNLIGGIWKSTYYVLWERKLGKRITQSAKHPLEFREIPVVLAVVSAWEQLLPRKRDYYLDKLLPSKTQVVMNPNFPENV